jgi:hypothetical protein
VTQAAELLSVVPGSLAQKRYPQLYPGLIVSQVNGASVAKQSYEEILEQIKTSDRPLSMVFTPQVMKCVYDMSVALGSVGYLQYR